MTANSVALGSASHSLIAAPTISLDITKKHLAREPTKRSANGARPRFDSKFAKWHAQVDGDSDSSSQFGTASDSEGDLSRVLVKNYLSAFFTSPTIPVVFYPQVLQSLFFLAPKSLI